MNVWSTCNPFACAGGATKRLQMIALRPNDFQPKRVLLRCSPYMTFSVHGWHKFRGVFANSPRRERWERWRRRDVTERILRRRRARTHIFRNASKLLRQRQTVGRFILWFQTVSRRLACGCLRLAFSYRCSLARYYCLLGVLLVYVTERNEFCKIQILGWIRWRYCILCDSTERVSFQ